jgi:hypothetical protein
MRALPHHIISAALCVLHLQGVWSVAQSGEQGGVEKSVAFKEDVDCRAISSDFFWPLAS